MYCNESCSRNLRKAKFINRDTILWKNQKEHEIVQNISLHQQYHYHHAFIMLKEHPVNSQHDPCILVKKRSSTVSFFVIKRVPRVLNLEVNHRRNQWKVLIAMCMKDSHKLSLRQHRTFYPNCLL